MFGFSKRDVLSFLICTAFCFVGQWCIDQGYRVWAVYLTVIAVWLPLDLFICGGDNRGRDVSSL